MKNEIRRKRQVIDYFKLGRMLFNSRDYSLALNGFNTAINLDPNNPLPYHYRGLVFYKLGDKENAIKNVKVSAKFGHKKSQELLKTIGLDW